MANVVIDVDGSSNRSLTIGEVDMDSARRLSRLQTLWVKTLKTNDRVKIDRRHRKLVAMKVDFKSYSFLIQPFFVYNNVLYKDPSLKI